MPIETVEVVCEATTGRRKWLEIEQFLLLRLMALMDFLASGRRIRYMTCGELFHEGAPEAHRRFSGYRVFCTASRCFVACR